MPTLRLPLVGSYMNRNPNAAIADAKDQRFTNCFPEVSQNTITGKKEVWLNKRQGASASSDVSTGALGSFGAVVWTANSAAVAPAIFSYLNNVSTVAFYNSAGTQIGGAITSTGGCLSMEETDLSGTGNLTAMLTNHATSTVELHFFAEAGAWTKVTSSPLTSSPICPAHAHMDGYPFVMREDGRLYHGDVNTVSSWPSTNFITANSYADNGVGCARYRNLIVGFGDYSTEFFYNAGNATGSVLSRIENATLRVGAIRNTVGRGTAIRTIGNNVYWLGINADTGAKGVYRFNGMQAEKVSGPGIDKLVANGALRSIVGSFSLLGMTHIAFGGGTTSVICFCPDNGFWWHFTPAGNLTISAVLATADSSAIAKSYFSTATNAKVYTFDPSSPVWQDNAAAYTMTVQTDSLDVNTDRKKFWQKLHLTYDPQASNSEISVSYSDDGGSNYSSPASIDTVSTNPRSWVTRLGASRRRSWKFEHSTNTPCRIKAVEIDYEIGL